MHKLLQKIKPESLAAVFTLMLIVAWMIVGGCRERISEPISGIQEKSQKDQIRVLLKSGVYDAKLFFEGSYRVNFNDPSRNNLCGSGGKVVVAARNSHVYINGKPGGLQVDIIPQNPDGWFRFDSVNYRGKVRIIPWKNGTLRVINILSMENYLAGVVAAEMPASWEFQAIKAQTITARTYSLYIKERFGSNRTWDVRATQANQVYRGINAEHPQTWKAVRETAGMVLTSEDSETPDKIFPAYYSSVCGGHTENSKFVFGDSYAPLQGVECPWCKKVAGKKFYSWKDATISKNKAWKKLLEKYPQLEKLEKLKEVKSIRKSDFKDFSRHTRFQLVGTNGKKDILGGEDFRLCLDPSGTVIKSAAFNFNDDSKKLRITNGRGFGHGVGMCQYGALELARKGKTALQILDIYFPQSTVMKLY